jgi:hypothetical protein
VLHENGENFNDFGLSLWLLVDIDPAFGQLHRVEVDSDVCIILYLCLKSQSE